jgi:hypothetical protein
MQPVSASQLPLEYPAAIFPSRLEWLCQPEQIERTLLLIYYLNFWKKAHQQLLYVDRQGLYEAQAFVLEQATKVGVVQATVYLDGTHRFPDQLLLESVAENAARGILIHLNGQNDPHIWPPFEPEGDRIYQRFIRPLYRRITGKDFKFVADAVMALEGARIREYIHERLLRLIAHARTTRQAIPTRRLAALCIAPIDLLHIRDNRMYFLETCDAWEELDISDQRKLDPEGYSEVVFQYSSPSAEFIFHLPLRWAELFVGDELLLKLQRAPGISLERGTFCGKLIDDEESQQHPAKEILQDLGVEIRRVCPHELLDKESFLSKPSIRDILWPTRFCEEEDWHDDPWDCICLPPDLI